MLFLPEFSWVHLGVLLLLFEDKIVDLGQQVGVGSYGASHVHRLWLSARHHCIVDIGQKVVTRGPCQRVHPTVFRRLTFARSVRLDREIPLAGLLNKDFVKLGPIATHRSWAVPSMRFHLLRVDFLSSFVEVSMRFDLIHRVLR